jgi:hypothetical protein
VDVKVGKLVSLTIAEGDIGMWHWYKENIGYTLVARSYPYSIPAEVTKWCHENFNSDVMRYYPATKRSNDEVWFKSDDEVSIFLLRWA